MKQEWQQKGYPIVTNIQTGAVDSTVLIQKTQGSLFTSLEEQVAILANNVPPPIGNTGAPAPAPAPATGQRLYAYFRSSNGSGWVGNTLDGTTWTFVNSSTFDSVTDSTWGKFYISGKPNGSKLMITGFITGGMRTSTDNGASWATVPSIPDTVLIAPACWTGTHWIFGRLSIYRMDDNNANITTVLASTGGNGFDIKRNPTTGTILFCGGQGSTNYCWRSTDNGLNWTRTGFGILTDYWRGVCYSPTLNMWIGFGTGGLTRSTDDGLTWSARYSATTECVVWIPEDSIFVTCIPSEGLRTSTDGINWSATFLPTNTTDWYNIVKFKNVYFGRAFFNGVASLLTSTTLNGPWTQIPTPGITPTRSQGFFLTDT